MSADQITKSIRRIVRGLEDDPIGLADADEYKSIGTSRGEAFINSRGDVTGSASEGSDDKEEKPSSTTPPTDNPDDNDTGGEGGTNSGSDPSGAEGGDVADVDDALTTATQIGTLTGTDPTAGTLMSLNLNTLEGIEYIPPDTWDDPVLGPIPDGFTEGFWWITTSAGGNFKGEGAFPLEAAEAWIVDVGSSRFSIVSGPTKISDIRYDFDFFDNVLESTGTQVIDRLDCSGNPNATFCTLTDEDVAETPWPSDNNCQVVFDEAAGGYKGNILDTDCSAAQKLPTDFVIIRSVTDPSKFFRYTRLANGGTKITQVDSGGTPVPGTITKTTDEGGRVDGFFDVSLDAGIT